jgi:hypothetical protein
MKEKLKPSLDAVESPVGDETVLLHLKSGTYFGLDSVGTRIWQLLKEGLHPRDICERLTAEYEISKEVAEVDTASFLSSLKMQDLVEEA